MQEKPMRQVTDHKIEGGDSQLDIVVLDPSGAGGASHVYQIIATVPDFLVLERFDDLGLSAPVEPINQGRKVLTFGDIRFQNGPIHETGLNRITQESLIAICIDRLRSFQSGEFACKSNTFALEHLELALGYLQQRTHDRLARGVEGRLEQ
jgi:hypothetical protein